MLKPYLAVVSLLLLMATAASAATRDKATQPAASTGLPVASLHTFARVLTLIQKHYVEPTSDKQLINAAIAGMVSSLDPHSAWLDTSQAKGLKTEMDGRFGGIGIRIGVSHGHFIVISPLDNTPASDAGIKPGDLILAIDGRPTQDQTMADIVKQLRGKTGSKVTLTLKRPGQDTPLTLSLTRAVIHLSSVKSRLLDKQFGYLRITQFQENTGKEVKKALSSLEAHKGFTGLVLDLRNNPGGSFEAAVKVADLFLNKGVIVYTLGRPKNNRASFNATPGDALNAKPMVVLVNAGTASAAEILAGALKDNKRALLLGQRTFGKGSVQTAIPMKNGKLLKLTVARYYTPNGHSIQATGIEPDIPLNIGHVDIRHSGNAFREADLPHHLVNQQHDSTTEKQPLAHLEKTDFALYQALITLKGIAMYQPGQTKVAK